MEPSRLAPRLRALPLRSVVGHEVRIAVGVRARLLGLVWLSREQVGPGLLIPRCSSVHTFGMRFQLDLVFLDGDDLPLARFPGVPPKRVVWQPGAVAVLEIPARQGGEFAAPRT
jgi:hypothetical protein